MKKLIGLCILILLLSGCKHTQIASYVQLYETQSINTTAKNNFYIYENDTVKIIYSFWANKGEMHFSIYNKTTQPLYIDWGKSAFVANSVSTAYSSYSSEQSINFIPPKAYVGKTGPVLISKYFSDWGTDFTKNTEPRHDNPKKTTSVSSKLFTKENTPLSFRNYLTFSFRKDFSNEFIVDNEYFVKKISVMDPKHFYDISSDLFIEGTRFQKPTDFFVDVK